MGLFDKLLGDQGSDTISLNPREAFAAILLAAAAADGNISEEEAESVISMSNRLQLFKNQSATDYNAMMGKLIGIHRTRGAALLVQTACSALPIDLRESVFAVTVDLLFADGTVAPEERKLLEGLQQVLEIPESQATKIVEVMITKNRA